MTTHYHNARTRRRVHPLRENSEAKAAILAIVDRAGYPHVDIVVRDAAGQVQEAARDRSLLSYVETYDLPPTLVSAITWAIGKGEDYTLTHKNGWSTTLSRHTGV